MAEIVTDGRIPFHGQKDEVVNDMLRNQVFELTPALMQLPDDAPDGLVAIILDCLKWNPSDRPTAQLVGDRMGDAFPKWTLQSRSRVFQKA